MRKSKFCRWSGIKTEGNQEEESHCKPEGYLCGRDGVPHAGQKQGGVHLITRSCKKFVNDRLHDNDYNFKDEEWLHNELLQRENHNFKLLQKEDYNFYEEELLYDGLLQRKEFNFKLMPWEDYDDEDNVFYDSCVLELFKDKFVLFYKKKDFRNSEFEEKKSEYCQCNVYIVCICCDYNDLPINNYY